MRWRCFTRKASACHLMNLRGTMTHYLSEQHGSVAPVAANRGGERARKFLTPWDTSIMSCKPPKYLPSLPIDQAVVFSGSWTGNPSRAIQQTPPLRVPSPEDATRWHPPVTRCLFSLCRKTGNESNAHTQESAPSQSLRGARRRGVYYS